MPKSTFYHLPKDKQNKVLEVCKEEFESNTIANANVASIVKKLNIARGSFYQYFESLEECFFTVLEKETVEIHVLFMDALVSSNYDLIKTLNLYGDALCRELFQPASFSLYRNRFLYWTPELESGWQRFRDHGKDGRYINKMECDVFRKLNLKNLRIREIEDYAEMMFFIKSIVHGLIRRLFIENWDPGTFSRHYSKQMAWLEKGLA
ncbi:MAG: TetR family transcriptional regulator [Desulfitobacteriaceae bacterium]|nr:TetR family transcriptional regulator [Desulfitobacteriaceae bacterium]